MAIVTDSNENPQQFARESIVAALHALFDPNVSDEDHVEALKLVAEAVTLSSIAAAVEIVRTHEEERHVDRAQDVLVEVGAMQRRRVRKQLLELKRAGWRFVLRRESRWNAAGEAAPGWVFELELEAGQHRPSDERFISCWRTNRVDAISNAIAAV